MKSTWKRFLSLVLCMCMVMALLPNVTMTAFAATSGTVTGLADENIGLSFAGDADDAWSANGTSITGSATSTGGTCSDTSHNSTLTIKNNKATTATLSFDYAIDAQGGTIEVDGTSVTADGTFSKELAAGGTATVYIKSGSTSAATTITLTNVVLVSDVNATTTFLPAENGTYTVDGKPITEEYSNTQSSMTAYQVVATPAEGYQFLGWYNLTTGKCIATAASTALNIESDCTITAKFASKSVALFETGGQRFDDLGDAVVYARTNGQSKITLATDGSISGTYTIPTGITLLIPFDEAGTLYTNAPAAIRTAPASRPFRTLTMSEGTSITVNGAISLGGRYFAAGGGQQGRPVGDYGYIKMADNSSITVKNGGNLYAWGFISGSGSILAESGATVYEFYQIADFRGGSASSNMGNSVFPFSQYFVQNIEAPLTLNAGANEQVYSGVYAMSTTYTTTINFIGDTGMFKVESGSFTKDYDEKTDRLVFTVNGEAALNTLSLTLAGMDVNSESYVLPITNNITINIQSGNVTINQNTALLAGVEVNIAEGAGLTVANGKSIYFYDSDEWNSDNFVWGPCKFKSVAYAPGKAYNRSNNDLVDAKMDVNGSVTAIGAIYTTGSGADICSSNGTGNYILQGAPGTATTTYQYNANGNKAVTIPITPAKLHNADDTYTETAKIAAGTTIPYANGKWEIPVCDHQWDEGVITTEPGCVTDGVKTYTCTICKETKTEVIPATGHTEVIDEAVEATCTTPGKTDGKHCSVCHAVIVAQEVVPMKEHTAVTVPGKAATCTEAGLTDGEKCSVCGKELKAQETIKALGHKEVVDPAVEATCTETGMTEGKHCSVCNEILVAQTEVQAKGHTEVIDAAIEPTCTLPGKTEGKHCSVCNEVIIAQTEVQAKGHTEVIDEAVEATCTKAGKTEGKHCSVCNAVLVAQTEVQAKGHSWNEGEITTSPTCENAGVKTYTCTVCNATKAEAIDATGHTLVDVAEQPATCTKAGHTAGTKCSVCDAILSGMEEIPATGHTEVIDAAKAPTCTETGLTEGKHCSVCNTVLVAQEEIPAKGHTEVIDPAVAPTCTEPGKTEGKHCSVCNEVIVAQSEAPAKGHTEVIDAAVEATCTEPGKTEGKHCSVCNEITVAQEVIPAKGHTEVIDAAVEATCTEPGKTEGKHCSVCGEVITAQKEIPALGHSWGEWTVTTPASCTATGEETRTCDRCAATEKRELAKTGHREVVDPAVEATCTATGLTEGKHCSVCHAVIVAQEVVPMKEHTVVTVPGKAATCTEAGLTDGEKCSVCGKELKAQETIKALGHSWDEGKVTTAPTYEKTGVKTYTCGICKATKTESIPQLVNSGSGSSGGGSNKTTTYPVNIVTKTEDNGTTSSSSKMASKGNMVTITVEPDRYYVVDEVIIRDSRGKQLPVKDNGDGTYTFEMPADKVMVEPTFSWVNPFVDVKNTAYYTSAVEWTLKRMITQGTTDITFTPNGSCTRAHIVTFLWRAAGSPEPESAVSFADVPAGSYYAKAVAWAVENGITLGTTDVTFSPNAACTRAQSVTFLYRASEASASGAPTFYDVAEDAYYAAAVKWATDNGITNGIGNGLFGSNNTCTRAQIVTFLWRSYMGK